MKKISNRALSVLLIVALVIAGMGAYVLRYIDHGEEWALYFSRANSGSTGKLLDKNGIILASFSGIENLFSPDELTRKANYHVTGDYWGRTGTGILTRYWNDVHGFSLLTGTTRSEDSVLTLNIDARTLIAVNCTNKSTIIICHISHIARLLIYVSKGF